MNKITEILFRLQTLQLRIEPMTLDAESEILKLRAEIPEKMLERFDRFIVRGKKAVARVRHGVCGECHLRVTLGTLVGLAHPAETHLCDNCGRYLHLSETESAAPIALPPLPMPQLAAKKSRKTSLTHGYAIDIRLANGRVKTAKSALTRASG